MDQIIVSFPKEPSLKKNEISEIVNRGLDSIKAEVLSWNGFVDLRTSDDGNYILVAKCDNEEIRSKMQWLLNVELNRLNAA